MKFGFLQVPDWSSVALAKLFQGVSSPAFPAERWKKSFCWGRYASADFDDICKVADRELELLADNT